MKNNMILMNRFIHEIDQIGLLGYKEIEESKQ